MDARTRGERAATDCALVVPSLHRRPGLQLICAQGAGTAGKSRTQTPTLAGRRRVGNHRDNRQLVHCRGQ